MTGKQFAGLRAPMVLALLLLAQSAWAQSDLEHMPVVQAEGKKSITLVVRAPSAQEPDLRLHYREAFSKTWTDLKFLRKDEDVFVATIPSEAAHAPGVEYFIAGSVEAEGPQEEVFASESEPHRILIRTDEKARHQSQILDSYRGRRSKVNVAAEWVNFGSRTISGALNDGTAVAYSVPDNYLRIDLDFTYRLVKLPIRSLRFGYTRLLGETRLSDVQADCFGTAKEANDCSEEAGYKVGGWFELGLSLQRATAIDLRGMVMATAEGFSVGGRSEFRIGDRDGTHLAAGLEYMADVGSNIFMRMGWDSVPKFPMALTIAGSDMPADRRSRGLRVLYDVAREVQKGLRVGLRVNYQSRDDLTGAVGGGLISSFEF